MVLLIPNDDCNISFRSDTEVANPVAVEVGIIVSEVAEDELDEKLEEMEKLQECFTPKCVKDEHEGRRFDDRDVEESNSEEE